MCGLNFFLIFIILASGVFGAVDITKYLKVCNRNALDVSDCLVDAVKQGVQTMVDGIPDLGVPAIDPFMQKDFKLDYNNNQLVAKLRLKNVYVRGMKEAVIHDARLRADDDKFHLEVDITSPKISIDSEFHGEGQFNALKILAFGSVNTTLTDLVYTWKLDGIPEKNGTDTYVQITDFYMRPDVGNLVTLVVNNNPDSRELTDLGTRFANANWKTLYKEFLPYAQANWKKNGIRIANKIFSQVPYDQIFPV